MRILLIVFNSTHIAILPGDNKAWSCLQSRIGLVLQQHNLGGKQEDDEIVSNVKHYLTFSDYKLIPCQLSGGKVRTISSVCTSVTFRVV